MKFGRGSLCLDGGREARQIPYDKLMRGGADDEDSGLRPCSCFLAETHLSQRTIRNNFVLLLFRPTAAPTQDVVQGNGASAEENEGKSESGYGEGKLESVAISIPRQAIVQMNFPNGD